MRKVKAQLLFKAGSGWERGAFNRIEVVALGPKGRRGEGGGGWDEGECRLRGKCREGREGEEQETWNGKEEDSTYHIFLAMDLSSVLRSVLLCFARSWSFGRSVVLTI